jgi:NAD(P)-dependent dehydrogenase (short-subunit alcohol dehydrogenase family)
MNNAGIIRRADTIDFHEKDGDEVMQLNSNTIFFLAQAAARDMIKQQFSRIISTASLLSLGWNPESVLRCKHRRRCPDDPGKDNEWAKFRVLALNHYPL